MSDRATAQAQGPLWLSGGGIPDSRSPRAFVTVKEAARMLGVSEDKVRRLCRSGELPAIRTGRGWSVEAAALREFSSQANARSAHS